MPKKIIKTCFILNPCYVLQTSCKYANQNILTSVVTLIFSQKYYIMNLPFNLMWNNLNLETYKQKMRKIVFCNIFKFYWAWILSCGHPHSDYKIFCKKCWLLQFFLRDAKRSWNAIFTIRCTKITTKEKDHSNWGKEIWNRFNHTLSEEKQESCFLYHLCFKITYCCILLLRMIILRMEHCTFLDLEIRFYLNITLEYISTVTGNWF